MAETDCYTSIDNIQREQSVYVQSSMDSLLEKKSSGVLRSKTKVRCWLHGSTLYEQKDQEMKLLDLCEAQTVRKVTNDINRVQFEIVIKKKTHTYICSTSVECEAWVTALQKCMMLKDSKDRSLQSQFFTETDPCLYSSIDDLQPAPSPVSQHSAKTNEAVENVYYMPHDAKEPTANVEYEDVVMRGSSYVKEIQNGKKSTLSHDSTYTDGVSMPAASSQEQAEYIYTDSVSTSSTSHQASPVKKTIDHVTALAILTETLDECDTQAGDLPYSLKSDDISCLRDLKAYLRANKTYCSRSSTQSSNSEDPVAALKMCLASLNVN